MLHLIIILHFLCFALGVGLIALSWVAYKEYKIGTLKDIVIVEIFFSIFFFLDSIGIYIRNIVVQYKAESIIKVINYLLMVAISFYTYKIIKKVKVQKLYKNLNLQIRNIIGLIIVAGIFFLFSYKIKFLQGIPYLCIIYFLQCMLGIVFVKEKIQEVKREKIQEEKLQEEKIVLKCLTNREKEIVDYVVIGLSYKEIGEKLFISANTVKNHVYNIYKKVNVKNKVELINLVNNKD